MAIIPENKKCPVCEERQRQDTIRLKILSVEFIGD